MRTSSWLGISVASCLGVSLLMGGCLNFNRRAARSSSVVTFLYPNEKEPLPPTAIPVLRLPLRVGIAFVPGNPGRLYSEGDSFSEMQKSQLLERVAEQFRHLDYIRSIEIVPSTYLRPGGGFINLDQVRNLLSVDVIALVAYDQVQFTDENLLSLSYWTIVGAYLFHGDKNDTQTLMEAAVYDIPSRHLLFRAAGASRVQGGSTAIKVGETLRAGSGAGFGLATDDLIKNLKDQLQNFRQRMKEAPGEVQIQRAPGFTGGGSFGWIFAAAAAVLGAGYWVRRPR